MTGGGTRLPVVGGVPAPGACPGFQRIAVIGVGALGGSLALALRRAWPQSLVIGVDAPGVIEAAMRMHAIDVGSHDLMIAGDAELVVLAGVPAENARVLPYLADAIPGEAVVLALGGDERVVERARSLPGRLSVIVGVASVGLPGSGISAASAELLHGRRWTMTPVTAGRDAAERVRGLIVAIGGSPESETPSA